MSCDICGNTIKTADFYLLTTSQVVYSEPYWEYLLRLTESKTPGFEKHPSGFLQMVKELCASQSDWAVCTNCIRYFDVDKNDAKKRARDYTKTGQYTPIPESGAADEGQAFLGASIAWKEIYGSNLVELLKTEI
jgi:hypothetical protein